MNILQENVALSKGRICMKSWLDAKHWAFLGCSLKKTILICAHSLNPVEYGSAV